MDSIAMPVTIVVKAPNQQIEDQTIHCELDWTIKRLKGYLSEVYPSKPRLEDQKLIYSGQLLVDTAQLKDVLRTYDGQENHTVHLVCSPPRDFYKSSSTSSINSGKKASTSRGTTGNRGVNIFSTTPTTSNPNLSNLSNSSSSSSSSDIGRPNILPHQTESEPLLETSGEDRRRGGDPRELWAAAATAAAASYPNVGVYSGANVAHQMAWMQQAYSQYMSHYMQFLASSQGGANGPVASRMGYPMYSGFAPGIGTVPGVPQPQTDIQPQQPNAVAANNQQDDEEEVRGNRDWLDWFYIMSRVLVLFSIIYFYSSPVRFLMVTTLGMIMYLYQVGFFRMQGLDVGRGDVALNNNGNVANLAAAERENNNDQPNPAATTTPAPASDANSENNSTPQPQDADTLPPAEPERPSFLALTWTILCSFLLSLIPEQPNVI